MKQKIPDALALPFTHKWGWASWRGHLFPGGHEGAFGDDRKVDKAKD